jgi:opacity protein-like surface antigen
MKKQWLLSTLFTILPLSAMASESSFNYVEGGYTQFSKYKGQKENVNGIELSGRFEIDPSFFVLTDFQYIRNKDPLENKHLKMREKSYALGGGYKMQLNTQTILFTHANYIQGTHKILGQADPQSYSRKMTYKGRGYKVGLGAKVALTHKIEVSSEFSYFNYGKLKHKAGNTHTMLPKYTYKQLKIAAHYKIMDPLSVYLSAQRDFGFSYDPKGSSKREITSYALGVRYSF